MARLSRSVVRMPILWSQVSPPVGFRGQILDSVLTCVVILSDGTSIRASKGENKMRYPHPNEEGGGEHVIPAALRNLNAMAVSHASAAYPAELNVPTCT